MLWSWETDMTKISLKKIIYQFYCSDTRYHGFGRGDPNCTYDDHAESRELICLGIPLTLHVHILYLPIVHIMLCLVSCCCLNSWPWPYVDTVITNASTVFWTLQRKASSWTITTFAVRLALTCYLWNYMYRCNLTSWLMQISVGLEYFSCNDWMLYGIVSIRSSKVKTSQKKYHLMGTRLFNRFYSLDIDKVT